MKYIKRFNRSFSSISSNNYQTLFVDYFRSDDNVHFRLQYCVDKYIYTHSHGIQVNVELHTNAKHYYCKSAVELTIQLTNEDTVFNEFAYHIRNFHEPYKKCLNEYLKYYFDWDILYKLLVKHIGI